MTDCNLTKYSIAWDHFWFYDTNVSCKIIEIEKYQNMLIYVPDTKLIATKLFYEFPCYFQN